MWTCACVGIYQILNWKIHGGTLKLVIACLQMISLSDLEISTTEGSKGMRKGCWNLK